MKRTSYAWLLATAMVFALAPTAAYAASDKKCPDTVAVTPPSGGFTQTTTTTQNAACNSASEQTISDVVEGPVTNKGGGTPGGFNK